MKKNILQQQPNSEKKERRKSHERLRKAYLYFDQKIKAHIKNDRSDSQLAALIDIYTTFTEFFKVLYMEATKLEEAFVIFETLNARGKDLETADLLKNYILSQSGNKIDSSLKKWNSTITKLDKCDPTKFIRAYWNGCHDFTREKALYRAINQNITTPRGTSDLLSDLDKLATAYHDMYYPDTGETYSNKELIQSLRSLKLLKATTFFPVILTMKRQNFSEEDIRDVAITIESYVFRNFTICGKNANSTETYFADIAKKIYDQILTKAKDICKEISTGIVNNQEFLDTFKCWAGSYSNKDIIRYILRKIHKYLDNTNEINIDNTEVHIEHIMPEDNSKWKVDPEFHDNYLWRLGNLCLLSGTFNKSISNKPFNEKNYRYKESKIDPNKKIDTHLNNGVWDEVAINNRQTQFSKYAVNIWKK